jgi:2-polyprenyl-3-methyl-5-hydroxy-6-metoxy-1,4-benzoquinol methylase
MGDYYWDEQIEYLMNTRNLYYNDDYLEFLVKSVWGITNPVKIIDFGCGYGFLGLKLMPLLPIGSSYTGIDLGEQLLSKARQLFKSLPFQADFIHCDVNEFESDSTYEIAICHALLLHMSDPIKTLSKMINCVPNQGRIICFEPHWISNMSSYHLFETEQSNIVQLGILQKLFEQDAKHHGKDGNIGIKLPIYLSQLGVKNVECRMSDKVIFLDPNMEEDKKVKLYNSLMEDGIGGSPTERESFLGRLVNRGMNMEDAEKQYHAELNFSRLFSINSAFTGATGIKITSGIIEK